MCVFVFTLIINILIAAAYQEFINNFVLYLLFVYKLYRNEENKKETKTQNHMIDFRKNFQKKKKSKRKWKWWCHQNYEQNKNKISMHKQTYGNPLEMRGRNKKIELYIISKIRFSTNNTEIFR